MGNLHSSTQLSPEHYDGVNKHSNTTNLCDLLSIQKFRTTECSNLLEQKKSFYASEKFGKIEKKLYCLLGNGKNGVFSIEEIIDFLLMRNYPEINEMKHSTFFHRKKKSQAIFVPDWYLIKAVKYVDPGRGPGLQKYCETAMSTCPERKEYFQDMKNFHIGCQRTFRGEQPERNLYDSLKKLFKNSKEKVAVFHGIDILKLNLEKAFTFKEKDFVIINATYKYVMVIEVKKTFGVADSVEKALKQLSEAGPKILKL